MSSGGRGFIVQRDEGRGGDDSAAGQCVAAARYANITRWSGCTTYVRVRTWQPKRPQTRRPSSHSATGKPSSVRPHRRPGCTPRAIASAPAAALSSSTAAARCAACAAASFSTVRMDEELERGSCTRTSAPGNYVVRTRWAPARPRYKRPWSRGRGCGSRVSDRREIRRRRRAADATAAPTRSAR